KKCGMRILQASAKESVRSELKAVPDAGTAGRAELSICVDCKECALRTGGLARGFDYSSTKAARHLGMMSRNSGETPRMDFFDSSPDLCYGSSLECADAAIEWEMCR